MEIPTGTLRNILEEWADEQNVRPVDDKQRELTERVLLPGKELIEEELLALRREFDARIRRALLKNERKWPAIANDDPALMHPRRYPHGFCETIRNGIWDATRLALGDPTMPGMRHLRRFVNKGGVLKKISGIQHGKFFQNGVQAGSLWVDVANDTVDTQKPPIQICPLGDSGFKHVDDFSACGDVIESYWDDRVYPNTVFPFLAPFYPLIYVSHHGIVQVLPVNVSMIATNVLSDFKLAEDFLFRSRFSDEQLPPEVQELIGKHFSWDEDTYDFDCGVSHAEVFCRGGAPRELSAEVFSRLRGVDQGHIPSLLGDAGAAMNEFDDMELRAK